MERYSTGDKDSFKELFERYEARAYGYFLRRTEDETRARDLYQELFLRLHRFRDSYDPQRAFAPWFFRIAHGLLIDEVRRNFRSQEVPLIEGADFLREHSSEERINYQHQIRQLFRKLSPIESDIVVAAKVEGFGYSEISEQTGKSVVAVKQIASRALRRLRSTGKLDS